MELIKILKLDNKKDFLVAKKTQPFWSELISPTYFLRLLWMVHDSNASIFLNFIFLVSDHVITLPLIVFHSTVRCSSLLTLLDGYSE